MPEIKVAIANDFLTAFAKLPRQIQSKVTDFIVKFKNNPTAPGINYEKLKYCIDDKLCSVRIDEAYRGIVVRQEQTGVYLLLWVDHHDEAYDWAKRKKCDVNPNTGSIQIYDILSVEQKQDSTESIFKTIPDSKLALLGVPSEQKKMLDSITSKEMFFSMQSSFSRDVFENLSWIVEGFDVDEVIELITKEHEEKEQADLAKALENEETLSSFMVVGDEDELRKIMAEPLEKWRVFLHPTQRRIVNKDYNGPARVLGTAGTGKTVVAMHRAKYLASKLEGQEKVLFTTFTANLASDIAENLRKICTIEELRHIEVKHLDSWATQFLREQGYEATIAYDDVIDSLWEKALIMSPNDLGFTEEFYRDEWNRVVVSQEALSLDKYVRASRNGRGTRLDRRKRIEIWKVFETYLNLMKENKVRDISYALYECSVLVAKSDKKKQYKHIVVDEGQDFSDNAYRLIRKLAAEKHLNDIFIVGDSHQRIYKNRAALSRCGIDVRGRSSILRINYRTTEETRKAAIAILKGIPFDNLDDEDILDDRCQSLTHGDKPEIRTFKTANEEFDYLLKEIKKLNEKGTSLNDICVIARTNKLVSEYSSNFTKSGIKNYQIKQSKNDDRDFDGLRLATMHRVKGLEFQYVFVVSCNNRIVPLATAIDHTDNVSERETMTAEKCLLYVAITRAQKKAYITSYGKKSDFI